MEAGARINAAGRYLVDNPVSRDAARPAGNAKIAPSSPATMTITLLRSIAQ
jgi:hypothetical protein